MSWFEDGSCGGGVGGGELWWLSFRRILWERVEETEVERIVKYRERFSQVFW